MLTCLTLPGEVVELYGTEGTGEFTGHCSVADLLPVNGVCVCGASGKTELLYHLLCRCVMPVATGGLEVEVVFVDTDYSLDMLRLVSILEARLNAGTGVLRT